MSELFECKLNVILDLDNTIINSLDNDDRQQLPIMFQDKFTYRDMIPIYRVFARPHLQEFLDHIFAHYNVSVFTAAEKNYALFIIENFLLTKPERQLDFIFYRMHVDLGQQLYNGTKDLRLIWDHFQMYNFYPNNTIIIDDLIDVKKANPFNTIQIKSFDMIDSYGKPNWDIINDNELYRVLEELKNLSEKMKNRNQNCVNRSKGKTMYIPIMKE